MSRDEAAELGRISFPSRESAFYSQRIFITDDKRRPQSRFRAGGRRCGGTGVTGPPFSRDDSSAGWKPSWTQLGGGQSFEVLRKGFFRAFVQARWLKRFETLDEVAGLVPFICSPVASAIKGADSRGDGGRVSSCF